MLDTEYVSCLKQAITLVFKNTLSGLAERLKVVKVPA
jgi:hypothetical protein